MNFGNVVYSATNAYLLKEIKFVEEGKIPVGSVPDDIELVSYLAVSDRAGTDGKFGPQQMGSDHPNYLFPFSLYAACTCYFPLKSCFDARKAQSKRIMAQGQMSLTGLNALLLVPAG